MQATRALAASPKWLRRKIEVIIGESARSEMEMTRYRGASFHRNALRSCCAVHAEVGWSLTPACTTRRRSCAGITLTARGESLAAFDGRCSPGGCVAPRSNTPGILGRRALPAGRLARLGATPDFHHGLLKDGNPFLAAHQRVHEVIKLTDAQPFPTPRKQTRCSRRSETRPASTCMRSVPRRRRAGTQTRSSACW